MKKYLLGLGAVVLALSLSAFTDDYKPAPKVKTTANMHWFVAPFGAGDFLETTSTTAERDVNSDCAIPETIECERAYPDAALVDPQDPSQGVDRQKLSTYLDKLYIED